MPGNGKSFEAFVNCINEVKREWFTEDKAKRFKAYDIDSAGIYYTLKGLGLYDTETFERCTVCIRTSIANGDIE
jgi:hypothetical protein